MIRAIAMIALLGTTTGGREIRYVACPVYRDTDNGRKSGCWLVDNPADGTRYDVTGAPTKPDWNRAVLVEGIPAPAAGDPCGGIVLAPVRVSVLDTACTRHMLSAEGYSGRRFALPERNVRPLYEDRKKPAKPYAEGRFTIPFDYNSSFITYQLADYYIDATINYALDVQPATIAIVGHADSVATTVSGQTLAEPVPLAFTRADLVRNALILRGVPANRITVSTAPAPREDPLVPAAFDGLTGPVERRVDVRIVPTDR